MVWFDPVGLHVQPGDTVRWVIKSNVHAVAVYHPMNEGHALRIPAGADIVAKGVVHLQQ